MTSSQVNQFKTFIKNKFRYKLYLDGVPSAVLVRDEDTGELVPDYKHGIPVGYWDKELDQAVIYNHLDIRVTTHAVDGDDNQRRIVGLEVHPKSVKLDFPLYRNTLDEQPDEYIKKSGGQTIQFSYTLRTYNRATEWRSRLDHYYNHGKSDILMKEMIFTFAVILVFGCIVAGYLKKSVDSDFAVLYGSETGSVNREQVGWHKLTTDLFRAPDEP